MAAGLGRTPGAAPKVGAAPGRSPAASLPFTHLPPPRPGCALPRRRLSPQREQTPAALAEIRAAPGSKVRPDRPEAAAPRGGTRDGRGGEAAPAAVPAAGELRRGSDPPRLPQAEASAPRRTGGKPPSTGPPAQAPPATCRPARSRQRRSKTRRRRRGVVPRAQHRASSQGSRLRSLPPHTCGQAGPGAGGAAPSPAQRHGELEAQREPPQPARVTRPPCSEHSPHRGAPPRSSVRRRAGAQHPQARRRPPSLCRTGQPPALAPGGVSEARWRWVREPQGGIAEIRPRAGGSGPGGAGPPALLSPASPDSPGR